jgi:DNA-binding FadR family transcriptional regulator
MRENVRRAREMLLLRDDAQLQLSSQHDALVEAIRRHDPSAAVAAAEAHLRFVREGIEALTRE